MEKEDVMFFKHKIIQPAKTQKRREEKLCGLASRGKI